MQRPFTERSPPPKQLRSLIDTPQVEALPFRFGRGYSGSRLGWTRWHIAPSARIATRVARSARDSRVGWEIAFALCTGLARMCASHRQVASKLHRYEMLRGPSACPTRSLVLDKGIFRPTEKDGSLPFRQILQASPSWYSACADRDAIPFADLQLTADSFVSGSFDPSLAINSWVGEMIDWRHQIAIQKKGGGMWLMALRHYPGSSCLVWPCVLRQTAHGEAEYFLPLLDLSAPELVTVSSFDDWQAASFSFHSPAWQHREHPGSRHQNKLEGVRMFKDSETLPLLMIGARASFWGLGKSWLQQLFKFHGWEASEGMSLLDLAWTACAKLLGEESPHIAKAVERRLVSLTEEVEQSELACENIEELDEVLERQDEKQVEQQQRSHEEVSRQLNDMRCEYRTKVSGGNGTGSRASSSRTPAIHPPGGGKYPKTYPTSEIPHARAKKLAPPDSFVWRSLTTGQWNGRFGAYPQVTRSWSRYGEGLALKLVLQELWSQYLTSIGRSEASCPIDGLFDNTT